MKKFPKIGQFRNAQRQAHSVYSSQKKIEYIGTVKLHGTNAGIGKEGENIWPQSRNRILGEGDSHMGFGEFVRDRIEDFRQVFRSFGIEDGTLFGEWIGPGVQRGVAISTLPEKQLVLFGGFSKDSGWILPPRHEEMYPGIWTVGAVDPIRLVVDYAEPEAMVAEMERLTIEYEEQCPWAAMFGLEGIGEGLVWVPSDPLLRADTDLWFKTKGMKHRKVERKVSVKFTSCPKKISGLVEEHLTERRLEQGIEYLNEMNIPVAMSSTKDFLGYVGGDLKKEVGDLVEAEEVAWSSFWKYGARSAVEWFKEKAQ